MGFSSFSPRFLSHLLPSLSCGVFDILFHSSRLILLINAVVFNV